MYNGALSDMSLGADPYTSNRYAFAAGNPSSRIEYDGHITEECASGLMTGCTQARVVVTETHVVRTGLGVPPLGVEPVGVVVLAGRVGGVDLDDVDLPLPPDAGLVPVPQPAPTRHSGAEAKLLEGEVPTGCPCAGHSGSRVGPPTGHPARSTVKSPTARTTPNSPTRHGHPGQIYLIVSAAPSDQLVPASCDRDAWCTASPSRCLGMRPVPYPVQFAFGGAVGDAVMRRSVHSR